MGKFIIMQGSIETIEQCEFGVTTVTKSSSDRITLTKDPATIIVTRNQIIVISGILDFQVGTAMVTFGVEDKLAHELLNSDITFEARPQATNPIEDYFR